MRQMQTAGMTHATVANAGTNEASPALYQACGFEPWHMIDDYVKRASLDVRTRCLRPLSRGDWAGFAISQRFREEMIDICLKNADYILRGVLESRWAENDAQVI